ncbi:MAG: hypothetical protein SH850_25185 [Planctomycetaceae bacterium]|nr:hypothetical protein [Planctomycetaceae bacterium]
MLTPLFAQSFHPEADFFVGWFTLALINAGIAQSKNRSGLLWWLISIVLGPVATFILVAFCDRVPPPTAS